MFAERLTVADQIRLFAQAGTIVAPHGAGIANIVYSDKPTLIELFPTSRWKLGYFLALVNSLGGEHIPIVSNPENDLDDYYVDIGQLETALSTADSLSA